MNPIKGVRLIIPFPCRCCFPSLLIAVERDGKFFLVMLDESVVRKLMLRVVFADYICF